MPKPKPADLLDEAIRVPDPEPYVPLHEYGQTIEVLFTSKKMNYREISEWLTARGLKYTASHVSNALAKWRMLNPAEQKAAADNGTGRHSS